MGQPVVISFFSDSFLYSLHCTEVCGLYTTNDVTMDNVQADCKAFEANTSCPDKELRIEKLKLLTRKVSKPLIKTISLQPGQSYDPVQEFTYFLHTFYILLHVFYILFTYFYILFTYFLHTFYILFTYFLLYLLHTFYKKYVNSI